MAFKHDSASSVIIKVFIIQERLDVCMVSSARYKTRSTDTFYDGPSRRRRFDLYEYIN